VGPVVGVNSCRRACSRAAHHPSKSDASEQACACACHCRASSAWESTNRSVIRAWAAAQAALTFSSALSWSIRSASGTSRSTSPSRAASAVSCSFDQAASGPAARAEAGVTMSSNIVSILSEIGPARAAHPQTIGLNRKGITARARPVEVVTSA
jgi:hypothetical protein